jgi:hypothetical protein
VLAGLRSRGAGARAPLADRAHVPRAFALPVGRCPARRRRRHRHLHARARGREQPSRGARIRTRASALAPRTDGLSRSCSASRSATSVCAAWRRTSTHATPHPFACSSASASAARGTCANGGA